MTSRRVRVVLDPFLADNGIQLYVQVCESKKVVPKSYGSNFGA